MSEIITFPLPTGVNYIIPDVGDENWGQNVTDFLVAIPSGVMPTSGTFSLTGDVSFGPTFGLVSQYFKTATTIPATAGFLRLSKTDLIEWRNNANSTNLPLAIDGSDRLTFNGTVLTTGTTGNLTDAGTDGITVTGGTGAVIGAGTSLSQHVSDSTHNGYLSSSDWTTFNAKGSGSVTSVALTVPAFLSVAGSPVTTSGTLAVSLSGTALPVVNGGTGDTSFTAFSVLCGGTISTSALQSVATVGLNGQFLQSQGPGLLPLWANVAGSGTVNSGTAGHVAYYATSTNTVSDGGSANIQIGSLLTTAASLQIQIKPGAHSIILDASSPAADRIYTLPDRGASDTFAFLGGQAQSFVGATTFTSASGVAITVTTNQLILGTTRTATISAPTPATASRTYTFPDQGSDYSVVATEGSQTINGAKTLTSALAMSSQKITGLANGTAAADAVNFSQLGVTNAHSQTGTTSGGTAIALPSFSITSNGGPILISGHAVVDITSTAGGAASMEIFIVRDATSTFAGNTIDFVFRNLGNAQQTRIPIGWSVVDTGASAGSHTYSLRQTNSLGTFNGLANYSLVGMLLSS